MSSPTRARRSSAPRTGRARKEVTDTTDTSLSTGESASVTNNNKQGVKIKMAGELSLDQINALMSQTRTKGLYAQRLGDFVASGAGGVDVAEQWPTDFGSPDKKVETIKQGFINAQNGKHAPEGSADVKVVLHEGRVYLLNPAAANAAASTTED